jgi:Obg family GTPase CgtA
VSQFVDECGLHVKAGDGGAGAVSFRREAHVARGGPDGGDGGSGGDVWLVADHNVASLLAFKDQPFRRAANGAHGQGKQRHGASGAETLVPVPEGTTVLDRDGTVLADLVATGDRYLAAEGGRGGRGNARFLSNRRRAPGFAEQGEEGEDRWLRLELKLLADVALVGFPNVGKSTLISRISAAKPKIADYPFTTLEPHLGVVRTTDGDEYVVADVPGLIEGASEGRGLGHRFLRHIERARVLCVLVDLSPLAERSPADQLAVLLDELEAYRPELARRPRLVVGSKADLAEQPPGGPVPGERPLGERLLGDVASGERVSGVPAAGELASGERVSGGPAAGDVASGELASGERVSGVPAARERAGVQLDLVVSAVTGEGIDRLVGRLAVEVRAARAALPEPSQFVVHRPVREGYEVVRERGGWVVEGREAVRAVALSDLTRADALAEAHRRLQRLGIDKALARAGAQPGDPVRIGSVTFDYDDA